MTIRPVFVAVAALGIVVTSVAQVVTQRSRGEFMRQKLEFAKNVLEGLTVENFDLVEKNARSLKRLSMAAEWEVPEIPHVEEYLPRTAEFQRLCDQIVAAARARNLDGATLGYVGLTTSCVNCHKYVRGAGAR
ncbi:MAG: hypothetical protein KatS3mg108_3280 [Isosphaeraceae bacterium]|jgi:hypothetical protein|nr:MAG: hypothetical protein KatS3mg108_3280 [Isosphaeraceae bacterium]